MEETYACVWVLRSVYFVESICRLLGFDRQSSGRLSKVSSMSVGSISEACGGWTTPAHSRDSKRNI
jgi:hypothetical protein